MNDGTSSEVLVQKDANSTCGAEKHKIISKTWLKLKLEPFKVLISSVFFKLPPFTMNCIVNCFNAKNIELMLISIVFSCDYCAN